MPQKSVQKRPQASLCKVAPISSSDQSKIAPAYQARWFDSEATAFRKEVLVKSAIRERLRRSQRHDYRRGYSYGGVISFAV